MKQKLLDRDPLTGLYTRYHLNWWYGKRIEQYQTDQKIFSLVIFNIDWFQGLNHQYSFPAGDEVLKQLATMIKSHFTADDIVVRFSGNEFVVVVTTDGKQLDLSSLILLKKIKEHTFIVEDFKIQTTLSHGICSVDEFPEIPTILQLLARADRRLFDAKRKRYLNGER